jgi:hypothetical protein
MLHLAVFDYWAAVLPPGELVFHEPLSGKNSKCLLSFESRHHKNICPFEQISDFVNNTLYSEAHSPILSAGFLTRRSSFGCPSHTKYVQWLHSLPPCIQWPDRSGFAPDSLLTGHKRICHFSYVRH